MSTLTINGTRKKGTEVRNDNATAAIVMANIVKNSFGPMGLDKMIVDQLGEINITNDGATILKLVEAEHPAAKILAQLANLQDEEVGDGTTTVVLLAAELISRGNRLIQESSLHPSLVISGFQLAKKEAVKFLAENLALKVDALETDSLKNAAMTSMSSKIVSVAKEFFAALAVEAVNVIKTKGDKRKKFSVNLNNLGYVKLRGDSLNDSKLIKGVCIKRERSLASFGMKNSLKKPKIAFLNFDLRKQKLPTGVKVVCNDPTQLDSIRNEEKLIIERRIKLILDTGANLLLFSGSVDEIALKLIAKANAVALKNVPKSLMKRLAKATGGRLITTLATIDTKDCLERVDQDALGIAEQLSEERVGDVAVIVTIETAEKNGICSLLLRGPSESSLDEAQRAFHDAMSALKRVLEWGRVVVGGGSAECALAAYLESFSETIGSREQIAVSEFAEALYVIPKTLAVNGAKDAINLVSALRAAHHKALIEGESKFESFGLDLERGVLVDNKKAGVLEPAVSKVKSLKFATEAAVTLLRIDDAVMMEPQEVKQPRRGR